MTIYAPMIVVTLPMAAFMKPISWVVMTGMPVPLWMFAMEGSAWGAALPYAMI